jgi:hypothetical protein
MEELPDAATANKDLARMFGESIKNSKRLRSKVDGDLFPMRQGRSAIVVDSVAAVGDASDGVV